MTPSKVFLFLCESFHPRQIWWQERSTLWRCETTHVTIQCKIPFCSALGFECVHIMSQVQSKIVWLRSRPGANNHGPHDQNHSKDDSTPTQMEQKESVIVKLSETIINKDQNIQVQSKGQTPLTTASISTTCTTLSFNTRCSHTVRQHRLRLEEFTTYFVIQASFLNTDGRLWGKLNRLL